MSYLQWITTDLHSILMVWVSCIVTYAAILLFTRLAGLRSFSKMSAADFSVTVAIGSLFASTVSSPSPALAIGLIALGSLYFLKWLISTLRRRFSSFSEMVDNEPLLLMARDTFFDENLTKAQVTRSDVFAKLREANAFNYSQVMAVIFETTGDISVIHSEDENAKLEPEFFQQVRDHQALFPATQAGHSA